MRRRIVPIVVAILAVVLAASPTLAGMEEEAERQLEFAREELADGRLERAIASAESALRLNPAAYEAFLIKGLAYEQLEQLDLARSLLVAYKEITKGLTPDPRVDEALARMEAAGRRAPRHRSVRPEVEVAEVGATGEVSDAVDVERFRERVEGALQAGECAVALATATELTSRAPTNPEGWRLFGDAARCGGGNRAAARGYRRYRELGGADPAVDLMLKGLLETLGTLDVRVQRRGGDPLPLVRLALPRGEVLSPSQSPGGTLRFSELPTQVVLALSVAGKGLDPLDLEVPPLGPGELRAVEVEPHFVGLGTVEVAGHDPALCTVALTTADGESEVGPGASERVTAGAVTARVSGTHGGVEVSLEVARDDTITFDPRPWVPASLTLVGLPTGSEVRVFVQGSGGASLERAVAVSPFGGTLQGDSGVLIAPPEQIDSLIGGSGGLFVSHPTLGEGAGSLVLAPGSVNGATFDWASMSGAAELGTRYRTWADQRTQLQLHARRRTAAPAAVAIGSAVASGVMVGLLLDADRRLGASAAGVTDAIEAGDGDALELHTAANRAAHQQRTSFAVGAGVAGGVAAAGFVITGVVGAKGRVELDRFGEWDPATPGGE